MQDQCSTIGVIFMDYEFTVSFKVEHSKKDRMFVAYATYGNRISEGNGTSLNVACSNALRALPLGSLLPVQLSIGNESEYPYRVIAGKKNCHRCKIEEEGTTLNGEKMLRVRYDNGDTGYEDPKFLMKC